MPDATSNQLRIFVSHSKTDKAACDPVVAALQDAGADVWYDEQDIRPAPLLDEIPSQLNARPVFVVMLSPEALASRWVQQECKWAYTLATDAEEPSRIILPVVVSAIDSKELNKALLFLAGFLRVEATGLKPLPEPEMIERTLWLLGLTPQGREPVAIAPQPSETLEDLLTQGRACLAQQDYAKALPFFERAAQMAPREANIWMNLGFTHRQLKQWVYALALYERAAGLDTKRANAPTGKGLALLGLKQYNEALDAFELGTKRQNGENSYAWNGKGLALRGLGHDEQALVAFNEAIKRRSTNPYFWGNKAAVLRALGRVAEAEQAELQAKELEGGQ